MLSMLFKCNVVSLLTNAILINIEQVRVVWSAHLFVFILIQSTMSFKGEVPKPWGSRGSTPGSGGPRGGTPG